MGVLFPAFSQSFARDPAALHRHYLLAFRLLATSLLPPLLLLALFAEPLLTLWIDTGFARQSAPLVPYLAAALAFSTLAQPAFYLIQAAGRSKTTALLHLAELPVYLTALWLMSGHWGAQGAASAWLLRTVVSCIYLNWLGLRLLRTRLGADAIACRQGQNPPVP
jgi:O-antigen/teichoic acid export membrane protein